MPDDASPATPDLIATPDATEALVPPEAPVPAPDQVEHQDTPVSAPEAPAPEEAPTEPAPVAGLREWTEEAAEEEEPEPEAEEESEPEPALAAPEPVSNKNWYVVKVQSGREDTIKEAIERRVKKEGLEEFYGQIVIPVEKYTEVKQDKNGRKVTRTKERKLYPGYLMVEVEYNDRILYLFRETSGVVDFVGSHPGKMNKPPTPMSAAEVLRMIGPKGGQGDVAPPVPPPPKGLDVGDRVRVVDGIFNGQEGIIKHILEAKGQVQVEVSIFGRPVTVDVEYYQVEEM